MGLRLLKGNFPLLGLVGLLLRVALPGPASLLVSRAVETTAASETLMRPGLVVGVVLVGVSLSGVGGNTVPLTVLEMRADTVTSLRSGGGHSPFGSAELKELSEEVLDLAAARCGFVPFSEAPGGVFMEPPGVPTPFAVTLGDVASEAVEGTGGSDAKDLGAPGWTGGRGARYLTDPRFDGGVVDFVVGEDGLDAGLSDGSGATWDLTDLGFGVRGFGWDGPLGAWGLGGTEGGCGRAGGSVVRLPAAVR